MQTIKEPTQNNQSRQQYLLSQTSLRLLLRDPVKSLLKAKEFNDQSIQLFKSQKVYDAINHLKQAQRILQHMAFCGYQVQRKAIVLTMYNLAALYQRVWVFEMSNIYLQAFYYHFGQMHKILQDNSDTFNNFIIRQFLRCRTLIQHCAVLSQFQNHNKSVSSAWKANKQLFSILRKIQIYMTQNKITNSQVKLTQFLNKHQTFPLKIQQAIKSVSKAMRTWRLKSQSTHCLNQKSRNHYKNSSITMLMQFDPINSQQFLNSQNIQINSTRLLLDIVLYFSLSLFTLGNQLRLDDSQKQTGIKIKLAQFYYLRAIQIYFAFVPVQSNYIKNLLTFYANSFRNLQQQIDYSQINQIVTEQANAIIQSFIIQKIKPTPLKQNKRLNTFQRQKSAVQIVQKTHQSPDQLPMRPKHFQKSQQQQQKKKIINKKRLSPNGQRQRLTSLQRLQGRTILSAYRKSTSPQRRQTCLNIKARMKSVSDIRNKGMTNLPSLKSDNYKQQFLNKIKNKKSTDNAFQKKKKRAQTARLNSPRNNYINNNNNKKNIVKHQKVQKQKILKDKQIVTKQDKKSNNNLLSGLSNNVRNDAIKLLLRKSMLGTGFTRGR